ncbi:response regulator transcription factor [Brevibacterium sp. SMBL_HHYL_HB1]|uniref:response regulator transcription factor n=1 Tax=Brevibacterium sp. SMBL_HHYL_HB1 TaxID=2777556 RepID=UPI001BA4A6CD|nr:response regulator transcription factor [Brevibacterium sp. SMBL_HHYL_HB1]QUL78473.1 response regulator transcription factor [Brevibacterium sp. SMBL_HHYL_HB1]
MTRILIVEDEDRIASFVAKGLRAEGFSPDIVEDGHEAIDLVRTGRYDLVVLDLGLPGLDGFSVLRMIRSERHELPVIILTARESIEDTVAGLSSGADDYMRKPFAFDELLARIRLRLRAADPQEATVLRAGNIAVDIRTRRAHIGDRTVELSSREFTLLEVFVKHPDQVLSRAQLLSRVWGLDFDPGSNVVDVYVRYLREKLGHETIETVRGAGYRLRVAKM